MKLWTRLSPNHLCTTFSFAISCRILQLVRQMTFQLRCQHHRFTSHCLLSKQHDLNVGINIKLNGNKWQYYNFLSYSTNNRFLECKLHIYYIFVTLDPTRPDPSYPRRRILCPNPVQPDPWMDQPDQCPSLGHVPS